MSTVRKVMVIVFIAASLAAVGYLFMLNQADTAYVATRSLARYEQINDADLAPVRVARNRPANFPVVTDKSRLIGTFAAQEIPQGTLFSPSLVVAAPPERRAFNTGQDLPIGYRGYPLTINTDLAPVLRDDDLVDVIIVNPGTGEITWLLSNVVPLYLTLNQEQLTATYVLALTPEQVAIVEGALADATLAQYGMGVVAYPRLVLSQPKNPALEMNTVFEYRTLKPPSTPVWSGTGTPPPTWTPQPTATPAAPTATLMPTGTATP